MKVEPGKPVQSRPFKYGHYGFVSDRGLNPKRVTNEDSYVTLQDVPLFAVADGVGGQNAGDVASQVVMQILKNQFMNKRLPAQTSQFLDQVIAYANRYLYDMAVDDELLSGMATTLALILLERKQATLSHVGDSRIYRYTDGVLYRETKDHSLVEELEDVDRTLMGTINRNIITRALGIEPEVTPETKVIPIPPNTTFLLCTDGITRHISDEELAEILAQEPDPQSVCEMLKALCYERGAKDNLTAIVVKMENAPWISGSLSRDSAESVTATEDVSKRRLARVQVDLSKPAAETTPTPTPVAEDEPATTQARTLTGHLPQQNVVMPAAHRWGRRVLMPLFLALAVVVAFFVGVYVRPVFSPTSSSEQAALPALTPTQQALEQGRQAFEAGEYTRALNVFRQVTINEPGLAEAHHWLGRTHMAMKSYLLAAESFSKAAALGGHADDYWRAAAAFHAAGDNEKAIAALAASLKAKR